MGTRVARVSLILESRASEKTYADIVDEGEDDETDLEDQEAGERERRTPQQHGDEPGTDSPRCTRLCRLRGAAETPDYDVKDAETCESPEVDCAPAHLSHQEPAGHCAGGVSETTQERRQDGRLAGSDSPKGIVDDVEREGVGVGHAGRAVRAEGQRASSNPVKKMERGALTLRRKTNSPSVLIHKSAAGAKRLRRFQSFEGRSL